MAYRPSKARLRTCVGCGERAPQGQLLRMALVEGVVRADPRRGLPGRGAYLHRRAACLEMLKQGGRKRYVFNRPLPEAAWAGFIRFMEQDLESDPVEKG